MHPRPPGTAGGRHSAGLFMIHREPSAVGHGQALTFGRLQPQ